MHFVKLLSSLFLLLIPWLVLYSVNCEICYRLVFIYVNLTRGRNRAILSAVILISALVLVPIKVECTWLHAFRDDGKF